MGGDATPDKRQPLDALCDLLGDRYELLRLIGGGGMRCSLPAVDGTAAYSQLKFSTNFGSRETQSAWKTVGGDPPWACRRNDGVSGK
jgi:hypothetical protein